MISVDETVRPAAFSDAAVIAELEKRCREGLVTQRGGEAWLASEPAWTEIDVARRTSSPAWQLMVAEIDGIPVGFGAAEHLGSLCQVHRIFVEPGARELGLGEFLLDALIAWGRAVGALVIESVALPGDRETKNMFERFGMKARLLVVSRSLVAESDDGDAS